MLCCIKKLTIEIINSEPSLCGRIIIHRLAERLNEVLVQICDVFEIILGLDASPDKSWEAIEEVYVMGPNVKRI
jgi:hypothetical protein